MVSHVEQRAFGDFKDNREYETFVRDINTVKRYNFINYPSVNGKEMTGIFRFRFQTK